MGAFIAGFLSTLLLFCFACQNQSSEQQTTTAIAVRLVNVQIKEMRLPIQSFGLLHFGQEQALAFKTDGFIQQILVKEGQRVKKANYWPRSICVKSKRASTRRGPNSRRLKKTGKD